MPDGKSHTKCLLHTQYASCTPNVLAECPRRLIPPYAVVFARQATFMSIVVLGGVVGEAPECHPVAGEFELKEPSLQRMMNRSSHLCGLPPPHLAADFPS